MRTARSFEIHLVVSFVVAALLFVWWQHTLAPVAVPADWGQPLTALEAASASGNGLQVKVKSLARTGGDVEMVYVFEWVGPGAPTFWRPHGHIAVVFYDVNLEPIGEETWHEFDLPWDFCDGKHEVLFVREGLLGPEWWQSRHGRAEAADRRYSRFEGMVRFTPPAGAEAINFRLNELLVTKPVPLPE